MKSNIIDVEVEIAHRQEKVEQAAAVKAGEISNPRHLIGIPPGTYHLVGEAAERELARQLLVANPEKR